MIYLIAKIFVYLLFALGLGAVAGWLWRHQQAAAREAEMERQLMDSRSRLPQAETALRAREQQIEGLLAEVNVRDEALAERDSELTDRDRKVLELERACAELRQRLEKAPAAVAATATSAAAGAAAGAEDELELLPGDPASAAAPVDASVAAPPAPVAEATPAGQAPAPDDDGERQALARALDDARQELDRARAALATEQRRVAELTQERALQHRALAALEQQLDMAREQDRRAAG